MKDEIFKCCECGETFVWNIGEQRFYASKGLTPPKRCPACRRRRRATLNPDPRWEKTHSPKELESIVERARAMFPRGGINDR